MPWVRIDDQFPDHPKVVEAGPMAAWLYVCGLTYCARQLTDGFIPVAQVPRLVGGPGVGRLAARLVSAGLWEEVPGGYRVHDFLIYNPSREQTLVRREIRASAGQRGGKQKASNLLACRQPDATDSVLSKPVANVYPVPVPVPMSLTETFGGGKPPPAPAAPSPVRAVPKPSAAPATTSLHQELFAALVDRFKTPANDAERRKFGTAAKLLAQADVTPEEVGVLADALEERWQHAECTPLAIANNVTTLRTPARVPAAQHAGRNGRPTALRTNLDALERTTRELELERGIE